MGDRFNIDDCLRQRNPNYVGNPLIERLPDERIFTTRARFYRAIEFYPPYRSAMRKADEGTRRRLVGDALRFFVPLNRHFTVADLIDTTIREGYRDRNPVDPYFWPKLKEQINELRKDLRQLVNAKHIVDRRDLGRASGLCLSQFGISGSGKSTFVREDLKLYEVLIEQPSYCGYQMNIRQVVYVYLEVEKNGSTTGLCRQFFRQLDRILYTNYLEMHGGLSVPLMLEQMAVLVGAHAIGLIVIDELQQLSRAKSGGEPGLLSFFLSLVNLMKVPILLIGTEESIPLVGTRLQSARRTSGIPEWTPLTKKEFCIFWKALAPYQYTRTPTDPAQLTDALYAESHGLIDFAVKIYVAAQRMLIGGPDRQERITEESLRIAARTYHPRIIEALRGKPFSLESAASPEAETSSLALPRKTPSPASAPNNIESAPSDGRVESVLNQAVVGCKDSAACYAALKQAGFIKSATEFL